MEKSGKYSLMGGALAAVVLAMVEGASGALSDRLFSDAAPTSAAASGQPAAAGAASSPSPPAQPPPASSDAPGSVTVIAEGEAGGAERLATEIHETVGQAIRPSVGMEGLRAAFRLSDISLESGARRSVSVQIALSGDGTGVVRCEPRRLGYHSSQDLAEKVAGQVNGALAASELQGALTCV